MVSLLSQANLTFGIVLGVGANQLGSHERYPSERASLKRGDR
ncbi:hypothetical protein CKA32_003604 [Geitlerinema sp. FC II]|nr:hypothetical protein CKA32_003604 [Geitlerinema sp. FC II]